MLKYKTQRVRLKLTQKDKTSQAALPATDISKILDTYIKTGALPIVNAQPLVFGDATLIPQLQEALGISARARYLYSQLPEQVRNETGGRPENFEGWLRDPRNHELAKKFGLLRPITDPSASPVPTASPTPTPSPTFSPAPTSSPSVPAPSSPAAKP